MIYNVSVTDYSYYSPVVRMVEDTTITHMQSSEGVIELSQWISMSQVVHQLLKHYYMVSFNYKKRLNVKELSRCGTGNEPEVITT